MYVFAKENAHGASIRSSHPASRLVPQHNFIVFTSLVRFLISRLPTIRRSSSVVINKFQHPSPLVLLMFTFLASHSPDSLQETPVRRRRYHQLPLRFKLY